MLSTLRPTAEVAPGIVKACFEISEPLIAPGWPSATHKQYAVQHYQSCRVAAARRLMMKSASGRLISIAM
jgi:hypothetical protein